MNKALTELKEAMDFICNKTKICPMQRIFKGKKENFVCCGKSLFENNDKNKSLEEISKSKECYYLFEEQISSNSHIDLGSLLIFSPNVNKELNFSHYEMLLSKNVIVNFDKDEEVFASIAKTHFLNERVQILKKNFADQLDVILLVMKI